MKRMIYLNLWCHGDYKYIVFWNLMVDIYFCLYLCLLWKANYSNSASYLSVLEIYCVLYSVAFGFCVPPSPPSSFSSHFADEIWETRKKIWQPLPYSIQFLLCTLKLLNFVCFCFSDNLTKRWTLLGWGAQWFKRYDISDIKKS